MYHFLKPTLINGLTTAKRLISNQYSKVTLEKVLNPHHFRLKLERQDDYATIEFAEENNGYHLIHTNVPEDYKGKGIGKIIAKKTFDYIVENDKRMRLSCVFLQQFYEDHREHYQKYVVY